MNWTNKKRKSFINTYLNDGLSGEKAVQLAFFEEKKEKCKLTNDEFSAFIRLAEERCRLAIKKNKG